MEYLSVSNTPPKYLNQIGHLAQLGFSIDYMATLPKKKKIKKKKTIKPLLDAFLRLSTKKYKKDPLLENCSEIHPFASLKLVLFAYSENILKTIPEEFSNQFPWLLDEFNQLIRAKPKKALRRYLMNLLTPLIKKCPTKTPHVL